MFAIRRNLKVVFLLALLVTASFNFSVLGDVKPITDNKVKENANFDTLVICPKEFQAALTDWLKYRQKQGHLIRVIAPETTAAEVKQQVRRAATIHSRNQPLKAVFIIGDVNNSLGMPLVPIDYVPAKVNVLFGSEKEIATDNSYADLDGDGIPELSIGRLPADSANEVSDFLAKVIAYETNAKASQAWQRNINFVAGVGGFGGVVDRVLENTAKQIITDLVPQSYQTSMTFGSWRSPYCPDPREFSNTAISRFNEGCMFWIYIGHGGPTMLDRFYLPDQSHSILDATSVDQVCCTAGNPIAIFLSCYTGAIDHQDDCLVEMMLRQPCGPVAAISGTRVTMPYAMSRLSLEMIDEYFDGTVPTLGELMMTAKQRMVKLVQEPKLTDRNQSDLYREMVQGMGRLLSPQPDLLREECIEHCQLIQLFGDPLLRLKRPEKIEMTTSPLVESGGKVHVSGTAPFAGDVCVELVYRRDRFRQRPSRRSEYISTDEEFRSYQLTYDQSHQLTCDGVSQAVAGGPFQFELNVPADASGKCDVRCMLTSPTRIALDSVPVEVKAAAPVRSARR